MGKGGQKGLHGVVAVQSENAGVRATALERRAFGLSAVVASGGKAASLDDESVFVVLKYYDSSHECFSQWNQNELGEFSAFVDKLRQQTWKNMSSGLQPKRCDYKTAKNGALDRLKALRAKLSEDIDFVELRVSKRARVHGFRMGHAFFLVLLDRDHQVFPE